MQDNPYASHPTTEAYEIEPERRTSIAAILGLVCSLVCCLPFVPALGALLGAIGLRGTMQRGKNIGGRGLAIAAIILGLLFSVGQIGILLAMRTQLNKSLQHLEFIQSLEVDDINAARLRLSADADMNFSDAQLRAWRDRLRSDWGAFVAGPNSGWEFVMGQFSPEAQNATRAVQQARGVSFTQTPNIFNIEFDKGRTPVCFILQATEPNNVDALPSIVDVGYVAPDGSLVWLSNPDATPTAPTPDAPTGAAPPVDDEPTTEPATQPDTSPASP